MSYGLNNRVVQTLGLSSALVVVFYGAGVVLYRAVGPWYLSTNLLLGLIPLGLTYLVTGSAKRRGWQDLRTVGWVAAWLGFLPNSFYLLTDLTHLVDTRTGFDLVYAGLVFWMFAVVGVAIGLACVYAVHREMLRRLSTTASYLVVELILLLSSIAIYLGKVLRWNTWDLVLHPLGILRDVARELTQPTLAGVTVTVSFFVLLSGLYWMVWRVAKR